MDKFFNNLLDKLSQVNHIDIIGRLVVSGILLSVPASLKYIFKGISYEILLYLTIGVLIYTFWKCAFFYKLYKVAKYAGLADFNEHSSFEKIKSTNKILANQIYCLSHDGNTPNNADEVDILLATGFDLFKEKNRSNPESIFYALKNSTNTKIRVLLLDLDDSESCEKRWKQIKDKKDIASFEAFRENILLTIKQLELLKKEKRLEYKLYKEVPIFKIIRIDNTLQIRPYIDSQWSFQTACFGFNYIEDTPQKSKNPTSLHVSFSKYFNELYLRSHDNKRNFLRNKWEESVELSSSSNGNANKIAAKIVEKSKSGFKIRCEKINCTPQCFEEGKFLIYYKDGKVLPTTWQWSGRTTNSECLTGVSYK